MMTREGQTVRQRVEDGNLIAVPGHKMVDMWHVIQQDLLDFPEHWSSDYTLEQIYRMLERDTLSGVLALDEKGGVDLYVLFLSKVTEESKTLQLCWIRGQRLKKHMGPLLRFFVDVARQVGSTRIVIQGRWGLQPLLAKLNFRPVAVVLEYEIPPERLN